MDSYISTVLQDLALLLQAKAWLAPLIAVLAGVLTSLTPCSLSSVPLVIAFVGGAGKGNPKTAFRFSLTFALGMAITFTTLGTLASLLGRLFNAGNTSLWYLMLGGLMVAMALQTWGIVSLIPSSYAQGKNTRRGYAGAFMTGILGGFFSSPCATPVLVALLALVARSANPVWGIALLLCYSIGHSVLVIMAGTFMGLAGKLTRSVRYGRLAQAANIVLGTGILLAGLYLLYLGF
jgi:cytochrome c biogenesis protein CcdA